ncbi:hypothetical protein U1Q18_001637 [Sarracenia purpurea var. burkii]
MPSIIVLMLLSVSVNVYVPKDRVTNLHQGYGFEEFRSEEDADYAIKVLSMIKLHGKPIRVNKASQDKKSLDVGANLFVGNLDPDVDEKLLYDTFSAFGVIVANPKNPSESEVDETRLEDGSTSQPTSEQLKDPAALCEDPKTLSADKEPISPKVSKNDEQSETSISQEKALRKPDKILPCLFNEECW